MLVVGGSIAQIKHRTGAARALWVLAFVATAVGAIAASEISPALLLILISAIAATSALVAVTKEPTKATATRKGAE
nr:hypothetical protein [Rhodococcus opacus]